MAAAVPWFRVEFVGSSDAVPDLETVDALVRLQLAARRLGGAVRLLDACDGLVELLDLAGLRREVGGQPEGGEEGAVVEEGVEPGDAIA